MWYNKTERTSSSKTSSSSSSRVWSGKQCYSYMVHCKKQKTDELDLKDEGVGAWRTEKGRLFQMREVQGALTMELFCFSLGTRKVRVSADERRVHDGVYSWSRSQRCGGEVFEMMLKQIVAILYSILLEMGSRKIEAWCDHSLMRLTEQKSLQ